MAGWILIFDNECEICSGSAAALRKIDKTGLFQMLPLTRLASEHNLLEKIPQALEIAAQELTLVSPSYQIYQGAAAIEKIIEILPLARPIRWMLERITGRSAPAWSLMKSIRRRCKSCP